MAKTQTGSQKLGLTRGKGVLIGVLAVALVGVLYVQYGRYAGSAEAEASGRVAARAPAPRPARSKVEKPVETNDEADEVTQAVLLEFDQTKWKTPELSKVVAFDPFALPAGFPRSATAGNLGSDEGDTAATAEEKSKQIADALAELRTQLDELKARGVHVIIGQKDQYVAMIGDRKIHVGDEIGNGFIVTEIDPKDGLRVEWKKPE